MTSEFLSSNYARNLRIVTQQSLTLLHCKTLNILPVHYITHLSVIVTSLTFLLQLNHSPVCYSYITHLSAILIGSMWSIHRQGFPWWVVWVRWTPSFIPGSLSISINRGPWALFTASKTQGTPGITDTYTTGTEHCLQPL